MSAYDWRFRISLQIHGIIKKKFIQDTTLFIPAFLEILRYIRTQILCMMVMMYYRLSPQLGFKGALWIHIVNIDSIYVEIYRFATLWKFSETDIITNAWVFDGNILVMFHCGGFNIASLHSYLYQLNSTLYRLVPFLKQIPWKQAHI